MEKIDQILDSLYSRVIEPEDARKELFLLSDVSMRFTLDDMRKAYDAAVFNPNEQTFDEWIKQAYNVC